MGGQNEGETDEGKSSTVGRNIASDCDEVDKVERPNTILLQMKRERERKENKHTQRRRRDDRV